MSTQISAGPAALKIALTLNVAMMGALGYVFNAQAAYGETASVRLAAL
jgi:hypothetical protein